MNTIAIHIAAFAGSLRQASFNRRLLEIAATLLPENTTMNILDLAPLPLFNEELEQDGFSAAIQEFRKGLFNADAILIATPEYNASIPGILKNAIDWASRGENRQPGPLNGKPLAIIGAGGRSGTMRAQNHLRQITSHLNMYTINKPEVLVAMTPTQVFDPSGNLTDETAVKLIAQLLNNLVAYTRQQKLRPVEAVTVN